MADQGCSRSACTRVAGADSGSHKLYKPHCQATQASCACGATTPPPPPHRHSSAPWCQAPAL